MPKSFPSAAVAEAYAKPRVDLSRAKITHGRPDLELLRKFCFSKFGWSKVRRRSRAGALPTDDVLHTPATRHWRFCLWKWNAKIRLVLLLSCKAAPRLQPPAVATSFHYMFQPGRTDQVAEVIWSLCWPHLQISHMSCAELQTGHEAAPHP